MPAKVSQGQLGRLTLTMVANGECDNITHLTEVLVLKKLDLIDAKMCMGAFVVPVWE